MMQGEELPEAAFRRVREKAQEVVGVRSTALVMVACLTAFVVVGSSALAKKGHVTVEVTNTMGKPVGGVPVYLRPAGSTEGFTNAARTNNSGQAKFPSKNDRRPPEPNTWYEIWVFYNGEWYKGPEFKTDEYGGATRQPVTVGGVPSPPPFP